MKFVEMTEATDTLAEYARKARTEPLIITVNGKPVAALVAIEDADMETVSLCTDPKFLGIIERSRVRQQAEGGLSPQEIRSRLELDNKVKDTL